MIPAYLAATGTPKQGAGKVAGIFVSAASATPTITVYDSANASTSDPTLIGVFTPAPATFYNMANVGFSKGLYVVISGTVTCTVVFE